MKEEIIAFTRKEKNVSWLIIAMLLIGVVGIELSELPFTTGAIVLDLVIRLILIMGIWFVYGVYHLFKIEEEKIRNNNCLLLLVAKSGFLWLPIWSVEMVVYSAILVMIGKSRNILISILLMLVAWLLAMLVSKCFRNEIIE